MAEGNSISSSEDQIRACIPPNYTYLFDSSNCKFHSKEKFAATFRIQEVTDKEKAKKWIEDLSQHSYVTWRCQTQPRCRLKNVFKSYMKCQHKTSSKPSKNSRLSKNKNCDASLILIVRRTNFDRFSRSTDPDPLLMDWPCIVVLYNMHNHKLDSVDILRFRNMSLDTQARLLDMFHLGHSPSSAFHTLETDLCLENLEACCDGAYLPTVGRITHFYNLKCKDHVKKKSVQEIVLESQKLLVQWGQNTGGKYVIGTTNDNRYYVALCTPLMCRVHELVAQCSDTVYLEAVGGFDRQRHRVYFLIVPTAAGGLPLGVIISNSKSEEILTSAISDLQSVCFPPGAFYFSGSPKIIVADRLLELNILQHHFPSATILINPFHVLQDAWCWLSDSSRNKVTEADRSVLYHMLKTVVQSDSEAQLIANYQELLGHPLCGIHHTFKAYIVKLWESKKEWASCYQLDLPAVGDNLSKCSNVAFRIMRDILFLRVMAFRLTPLVDFVVNQYEKYIEKTLLLNTTPQINKCLLSRFLPGTTDVKTGDICPHPAIEGFFLVPCSDAEDTMTYCVDAADMTCSCLTSCGTKMCKHTSAVLQKLVVENTVFSGPNTLIGKDMAIAVANGGTSIANTLPIVTENNETQLNAATEDGDEPTMDDVEAAPLVDLSQTVTASPLVLGDLTTLTESAASIIQYAIANGLFGENVVLKFAPGETESGDESSGETVSYQVPVGEYNIPVEMAPGDKSDPESTCTVMLTTSLLSSSDNLEAPAQVEVESAPVYLMEAVSDGEKLQYSSKLDESTITDSVTLNTLVDKVIQYPENVNVLPDSTSLLVDSTANMTTVENPLNMTEYSILDVAAITEIVIPDQEVLQTNDPEDNEIISDTEEKFDFLIKRIKNSKKTNPSLFKEAIRKMVTNAETFAQTEDELARALTSFAQPSKLARATKNIDKSSLTNTKLCPY